MYVILSMAFLTGLLIPYYHLFQVLPVGREICGTVRDIGSEVTLCQPGDEVVAIVPLDSDSSGCATLCSLSGNLMPTVCVTSFTDNPCRRLGNKKLTMLNCLTVKRFRTLSGLSPK